MARIDAAVLAAFLAALRRCGPAGAGRPPPPAVTVGPAADGCTLSGGAAGVALTLRVPGPPGGAAFATTTDALARVAVAAAGPVDLAPAGAVVRAAWAGGGAADLPAAPPRPPVPPGAAWQPGGRDLVRALRDAARTAGRAADVRYAYHRVLVDAPAGKVVATDGAALFAHGGFAWAGGAAVAVPPVGVWAAPFWADHGDPEVAVAADAVGVRAGPWAVSLPVDRAARFPEYSEVLARLRAPAARVALTEADAAAWAAALAAWGRAGSAADPVTLALADPPAVSGGDPAARVPAPRSAFLGRRAVRAATAGRPLARALALGFRTLTAVGAGHPLVALDGPRRFVWAAADARPPHAPRPST